MEGCAGSSIAVKDQSIGLGENMAASRVLYTVFPFPTFQAKRIGTTEIIEESVLI